MIDSSQKHILWSMVKNVSFPKKGNTNISVIMGSKTNFPRCAHSWHNLWIVDLIPTENPRLSSALKVCQIKLRKIIKTTFGKRSLILLMQIQLEPNMLIFPWLHFQSFSGVAPNHIKNFFTSTVKSKMTNRTIILRARIPLGSYILSLDMQ